MIDEEGDESEGSEGAGQWDDVSTSVASSGGRLDELIDALPDFIDDDDDVSAGEENGVEQEEVQENSPTFSEYEADLQGE